MVIFWFLPSGTRTCDWRTIKREKRWALEHFQKMEKSIFYTFWRQINIQRYGNDFLPKWRNKKEKIFYENVFLINLFQPNTEVGAIITQTLDVGSIRSVKVAKEGRRNIPKAFEIFTEDRTFILKAKDGSNAQEWVQCLSVAKAHSQVCYFSNYFLDFVILWFSMGLFSQLLRKWIPTYFFTQNTESLNLIFILIGKRHQFEKIGLWRIFGPFKSSSSWTSSITS